MNIKKIMIQGSPTRGKEVIKALKDLGGINFSNLEGTSEKLYYYIDNKNYISSMHDSCSMRKTYSRYLVTLEDYLNIKNNMEERTIKISLETAKEWYKGNNNALKELALQTFTEKELQNIPCVKSWEEFCKKYNRKNEYFINQFSEVTSVSDFCNYPRDSKIDKNLFATKEDASVFLAFIQLKRLRDQWWEALDWKPNYTNHMGIKYTIILVENKIVIDHTYVTGTFLVFPTEEIAEDFLNCFIDLIEKAKELI